MSKRVLTQAEVGLVPLKNSLVNLPHSLVAILLDTQTPIQDIIIEVQYRDHDKSVAVSKSGNISRQRAIFVGWTGMQSQGRPASSINKGSGKSSIAEIAVVEIDAKFGRMLGLAEGQKVGLLPHLDPPLVHTINIEPLTPADWEIIELHANFLELNLLSQIRAVPNPLFTVPGSKETTQANPLTLHLSPTSTANIIVNSLSPSLPSNSAFAKIKSNAEVIVSPKVRHHVSHTGRTKSRSFTNATRKGLGGKSTSETGRSRSNQETLLGTSASFLRPVDRRICSVWFDEHDSLKSDTGLRIWVDHSVLVSKTLRGTEWVCVSVVQPASLMAPPSQQHQQKARDIEASEFGKPASKVIARIIEWDDAPDTVHAAISSALSFALGYSGMAGGLIRMEAAPSPLSCKEVRSLKIFPIKNNGAKDVEGLRFGGKLEANRKALEESINKLCNIKEHSDGGILNGPLTDGLVLPKIDPYDGLLIRLDTPNLMNEKPEHRPIRWCLGRETQVKVDIQPEIFNPLQVLGLSLSEFDILSGEVPSLVGIDDLVDQLSSHISHSSSVLITGGPGSGKTSLACLLGHKLRASPPFYHVTYFECRSLVADETRVVAIKETFDKILMRASWGISLGGLALVILDNLDKLCPVETELEVGGNNGRSRQISEIICSGIRRFRGADPGITLLATVQSRESLNDIFLGRHLFREIISLKTPNKMVRRQLLQQLVGAKTEEYLANRAVSPKNQHKSCDIVDWTDDEFHDRSLARSVYSKPFDVDHNLDLHEVSGQTDGYMPRDLVLLVSRAKSEALIRFATILPVPAEESRIVLQNEDFQQALKGFTPASLRNVALQRSTTKFDAIGGLHEIRNVLLETLQYPTTYAPIFAQCPLRLRSGLLLYGYPGCGKTLLASAVAGECGLNFISVKGPEILNKYIGASEKAVRDLFERAEAARPCVLFFDEFDSIAPKRGHDSTGVTDRVVNQLLTQMDGAEGLSGVYILAATSRPDLIDPALLRPGRLDKSLLCNLPDLKDRYDILQTLSKKLRIDQDILKSSTPQQSLLEVALRTDGYSGADLQAVIYNAHLEAIHDLLDNKTSHEGNNLTQPQQKSKIPQARSDIIQFRYGDDVHTSTRNPLDFSQSLAESASTTAKINAIKQNKRKKHLGLPKPSVFPTKNRADGQSTTEAIIRWKHLEASLVTTKSSISTDERSRLAKVYREFIVGRNGEMPTGQGPTEVGARSSLM